VCVCVCVCVCVWVCVCVCESVSNLPQLAAGRAYANALALLLLTAGRALCLQQAGLAEPIRVQCYMVVREL
jgi:hypothetical protein